MVQGKRKGVTCFRVVLIVWLFFSFGITAEADEEEAEHPDRFAHEDVFILADQTVGKLMVAGGDAVVAGRVTDGIIVVDGNAVIEAGARVRGEIIVLGGGVEVRPGANVARTPWVVAPQGHPLAPLLIGAAIGLSAASLIILPVFIGCLGYFFQKTRWYGLARREILALEQRWPALYVILSFAISAFMLAVFTSLVWETIFRHTVDLFDNTIIWLVRYFANPGLDRIMIAVSDMGFGGSYIFLVVITIVVLLYYRRWREMSALSICLAGSAALNFLLKHLFQRARPEFFQVVPASGYSFPSGHAMASLCFYGIAAFLWMRLLSSWRGRLAVMTLAILLIVAIGVSRIYLGVHYPSDVAAGYAAGSMWLAFCISFLMWWERQRTKNQSGQ